MGRLPAFRQRSCEVAGGGEPREVEAEDDPGMRGTVWEGSRGSLIHFTTAPANNCYLFKKILK
jgi:hypothetical protein